MDMDSLKKRVIENKAVVCVFGLGYVGLPLCLEFANARTPIIGYNRSQERIDELKGGFDNRNEHDSKTIKNALKKGLFLTSNPEDIKKADIIINCVPTPVTRNKKPDLSCIEDSTKTIAKNMKKDSVVVLESTVYPGVTEEFVKPILEKESGMRYMEDFKLGYSPERVNPGDKEHDTAHIVKVVSGSDKETCELLAQLYGRIIKAGVYKAPNIKTAEAAKVIENIQRDLNIALVNELSLIFEKMNINTQDVLKAAGTKWNFHIYTPGLVGGHCIPVDPYYLVYKAEEVGYKPKIILAGREINNYMPRHVAGLVFSEMKKFKKKMNGSKILLLGLAFKKNVSDTRNAPSSVLIKELRERGADILGYDPLITSKRVSESFGIKGLKNLNNTKDIDCIILVTDHDVFKSINLGQLKKISRGKPILIDVRAFFNPKEAKEQGFAYKCL